MTCCIIGCMDPRIQSAIRELKKDAFIISLEGTVKIIATSYSELIMDSIALAYSEGVREIFLVTHTDCKAYGGRKEFSSSEAEEEKLLNDLYKAKENIASNFADLNIRLVLIKIDPCNERITIHLVAN